MTYTSRLFDAHRSVVEGFVIEQDGLEGYKAIKYQSKVSDAKIKYQLLERVLEIIAGGLDVDAIANTVQRDKEDRARAILAAREVNHVPAEEIVLDEADELVAA